MFKILRNIFFRAFFLYVLAGSLIFFFADRDRAWNHVVTSALSRYMPLPDNWVEFKRDRYKTALPKMKEFERYYRKVAQLMPFSPEAQAMAGYCYFYDGEIATAEKSYQQAVRIYPKVFNFHYNLGLISLKHRDLPKALEHFKNSVAVVPFENIQYIVNSRIYMPFLPFARQPEAVAAAMGAYTQDVYRRAYIQILSIGEVMKDYKVMLDYSRRAIASGFMDKGMAYYYAGRAAYELKEYENGARYFQEAVKNGFRYGQTFYMLGLCLKELHRPENGSAFIAAASLTKDKKVFKAEEPPMELLIY